MNRIIYNPRYYYTKEYENSDEVMKALFEYSPFHNPDGSVKEDCPEMWQYELDRYLTSFTKHKEKELGSRELEDEIEKEEKRITPIFKDLYKDAGKPEPLSDEELKELTDTLKKKYLEEFRVLDSKRDLLDAADILQTPLKSMNVKLPRFCLIHYVARTWVGDTEMFDVCIFEKELRNIWELIVRVKNKYMFNLCLDVSEFNEDVSIYYDTDAQCLCLSRRTPGMEQEEYEYVRIYFFDPMLVEKHLTKLDEFRKFYKIQTSFTEDLYLAKYIKTGFDSPESCDIDRHDLVCELITDCMPFGDLVDYIWRPDKNKQICSFFRIYGDYE